MENDPSDTGGTRNLNTSEVKEKHIKDQFLKDLEDSEDEDGEPEPKLSRLTNSGVEMSDSRINDTASEKIPKRRSADINCVETEINSLKLSSKPMACETTPAAECSKKLLSRLAATLGGTAGTSAESNSKSKQSGPLDTSDTASNSSRDANNDVDSDKVFRVTAFKFTARKRPRNFRPRVELDDSDDDDDDNDDNANHNDNDNDDDFLSVSPSRRNLDTMDSSSSDSDFSDVGSLSASSSHSDLSDTDPAVLSNPFQHYHFPGSFNVADEAAENVREACLLKPGPKHKWFCVQEFINRQIRNCSKVQASRDFEHRCRASLHSVQRLKLLHKLSSHSGCVNTLNFNQKGDLLISGSDDTKCILWNWAENKVKLKFETGHWSNIFGAKFLPNTGDTHVVTCGRDGQVRLALLGTAGQKTETRVINRHSRPVHRITTLPDSSNIVLSAGEDGVVFSVDLRTDTTEVTKLLKVMERNRKLGLYSIHVNPVLPYQFIVAGQACTVRLYDMRKIDSNQPLMKFYPHAALGDKNLHHYITSAVFNHNGTEILASYNYESIYLFDAKKSNLGDFVHCYEGHQNFNTIKGVNFFGPSSEYIVSGSDCGNIFFWEKETEAIVQCMPGDDRGVVNVLEPHPAFPFMATSGLDNEVKVWTPSGSEELTKSMLEQNIAKSNEKRKSEDRLVNYLSLDAFSWIDAAVSAALEGSQDRMVWRRRRGQGRDEE